MDAVRSIVTLPAALVAGFGAGFLFFRGPAPLAPAEAPAPGEREAATDAEAGPDSPEATDARVERLLAAALRKGARIERQNAMYLAIEAFTADDLRRLAADAGALEAMIEKLRGSDADTRRELLSGLIGRWLALDAGAVMTWASRVLASIPAKERRDREIVLDALAAKRPEELLALAASHKDPDERAEILSRALRELAARNPARARAWLDGCNDAADRRVAEKALRLGTVQADPLRAIELAGSIESRSEGTDLLKAAAERAAKIGPGVLRQLATTPMPPWMLPPLLNELAEREPELAVDLAIRSGESGEDARGGLQTAFAALARRDVPLALARMEELDGPRRLAAVSGIGLEWAAREPEAALAWLMKLPVSDGFDPSRPSGAGSELFITAFSRWAVSVRESARAWADALPAGAARDAVQTAFALSLAERGKPAEAAQVLARMGRAADPKAISEVAGAWARRDPQAAADWAIAQAPGPAQTRALAGVVGAWANDDPRGVEDWLAQFPPGAARDRSIFAFLSRGSSWVAGREQRFAEFETWFDRIDDPFLRSRAATAIYRQQQQHDPAGARAWLSALPNLDPEVVRMTLRDARR